MQIIHVVIEDLYSGKYEQRDVQYVADSFAQAATYAKRNPDKPDAVIVTGPGISAYFVESINPADVRPDLAGFYKHYKGGVYEVVLVSKRECDLTTLVHYHSIDPKKPEVWTRTEENFTEEAYTEELDCDGVPCNRMMLGVKRFTKIDYVKKITIDMENPSEGQTDSNDCSYTP